MGRIKTVQVKRITKQLAKNFPDQVAEEFDKNKALIKKHTTVSSTKMTNTIAGYLSRLKKQSQDTSGKKRVSGEEILS